MAVLVEIMEGWIEDILDLWLESMPGLCLAGMPALSPEPKPSVCFVEQLAPVRILLSSDLLSVI
jgi:hypothetical protein